MSRRAATWLLVGDGWSAFGSWIDFLAILTLAAYQYQVSSWQMALVSAAGLLPGMLAGPLVGRWCDAGDPKRLLLVSLGLRLLATAGVLLAGDYATFLVLVALRSVFATVAPPAINVMAVRAVPDGQLQGFYATLNVINNAAKVLAPAIGTVSSSLRGESLALVMSGLCSVLAFMSFAAVPQCAGLSSRAGKPSAAGVPRPASDSMAVLLWIAGTQAFMTFSVNNLVPLVLQRGGSDKGLLGILVSCSGAGNILAGLWLARRNPDRPLAGQPRDVVGPALLQAAGFGAIAALMALHPAWQGPALAALFFAIGTASARYAIGLNVFLVRRHGHAIGQASGRLQSCQNAMILLGPMVGAIVLDRFGGAALFAFAAGAALSSFAVLSAANGLRGVLRRLSWR